MNAYIYYANGRIMLTCDVLDFGGTQMSGGLHPIQTAKTTIDLTDHLEAIVRRVLAEQAGAKSTQQKKIANDRN